MMILGLKKLLVAEIYYDLAFGSASFRKKMPMPLGKTISRHYIRFLFHGNGPISPLKFQYQLLTQTLKELMKKLFLCLAFGAILVSMFSSCASTKRDCQGVKHTKQKGGFYM